MCLPYKMKFLCLLLTITLASGDRIVTTNSGPIRGVSVAGKNVEAFLGVPYAEPPVRFARPVAKSPWKTTYDANELPPTCIQSKLEVSHIRIEASKMSEDCLFLNLWVPEGGSDSKTIMVFIHGGGYMFGSSNWKVYDGASLSEHGDVIVATINYRVGTLGFFYGFTDEAPGNMGMYDQLMAIQWIKDNAKHFGGDPDNIVLFGESAGSFSVSLHMISPLSKKLFRRSILQSGSAFSPMYTDYNDMAIMGSQVVASLMGCSTDGKSLKDSAKEIVDCMKRLPVEKIAESERVFLKKGGMLIPRVGDDFLPTNPIDLYREGNFKDDEVLVGVTRDEGPLLLVIQRLDTFGAFGEKVDEHSFNETSATELLSGLLNSGAESEMLRTYFDRVKKGKSGYTYLNAISDYIGDFLINCGSVFQADFQSLKNVPVYFYVFDHRPSSSPLAEWMGVSHFEEVQYVFGNPVYKEFTEYEEELSKDIMDKWIAFAKTGNPNIPGGLQWPRYTSDDPKYYILGLKDRVGVRPDNNRCENWRSLFRAVVE